MSDDPVRYLRVKNWETYQDANLASKYRESGGSLPWLKQMSGRLEDYEYTKLHPLSRYIWGECIGLAARYGPNLIPYDTDWMQDKLHLRYLSDQLHECITELVHAGFLEVADSRGRATSEPVPASEGPRLQGILPDSVPDPVPLEKEKELEEVSSNEETRREVREVYDHWRTQLGKTDVRYAKRITPGRRQKIVARLKEFSAEELKLAIDGVLRDPWEDRPRHNDLTTVFRSQEQVEKFIALAEGERPKAGCPRCGVDCKTPSALTSHLANVHDVWGAAA